MELKRFIGIDSKATMDQVRAEYGDDALIISTNKVGNKTEMICAVEEQKRNNSTKPSDAEMTKEQLDISEATSTVASLLNRVAADNVSTNALPRAKSDEQIAQAFGREFDSALSIDPATAVAEEPFKAPAPKAKTDPAMAQSPAFPPESRDMQAMMQTIQEDLARLRSQLESQAAAESPLRKAQLAMASIKQQTKGSIGDRGVLIAEQVETLICEPLLTQKDWAGVHAFVGYPGSGKTTAVASLVEQQLQQLPTSSLVVISLQMDTQPYGNLLNRPAKVDDNGLAAFCQNIGVAFLQTSSLTQLGQLIERYRSNHQILIDTHASLLADPVALVSLVTDNELLPHLCLAADSAPSVIEPLHSTLPWIMSSTLITRFDLAKDLNSLLIALDNVNARVSGVNGHIIDEPISDSEKANSANTLEE